LVSALGCSKSKEQTNVTNAAVAQILSDFPDIDNSWLS
jgi:hypothetical protein